MFTVAVAAIWEPIGIYMDIWYYNLQPQLFGVSVLTLLMYFHWMCFSYFLGNWAAGMWRK